MKKLLSLLRGLAVAAVMLSTAGLLYGHELHFTHFNKEDNNLAYNSINTIFEDSRGYVWIGTHKGLSRYDGVRFKNYDKSDLGVASDFVSAICEDNSGNLWIGTDKGASIYRYDIDNFISLDNLFPGGARISERFTLSGPTPGAWYGWARAKMAYTNTTLFPIALNMSCYEISRLRMSIGSSLTKPKAYL